MMDTGCGYDLVPPAVVDGWAKYVVAAPSIMLLHIANDATNASDQLWLAIQAFEDGKRDSRAQPFLMGSSRAVLSEGGVA